MQWVNVLSALLTPTIAVLGVYIAYQQWSLNKANLREKLFERRFAVFKDAQSFLSEILSEAKFSDESFWKFTDACQRSRFLFGKGLQSYLLEIRRRAGKMKMYKSKLADIEPGEERTLNVKLQHDELTWLTDQLNPLFDKFEPFLGFEKYK